jgi:hypothetical protein
MNNFKVDSGVKIIQVRFNQMKRFYFNALLVIISALFLPANLNAQEKSYGWWNELHGWEVGMPGWKRWMIISPGYLGPNALPVPEVKKGYIPDKSEISFSAARHFHPGDPTQDVSAKLFLPFAQGKIAFEVYGVVLENYAFTEEIRNERFARDEDGRGIAQGDFYFSTLVQIFNGRKFPNTLFRMAGRTASGGGFDAARFSDNPGYFFDFSFSKDIRTGRRTDFRPFAAIGFYSWQTNNEGTLQNDALYYAAGVELQTSGWLFTGSFSGYSGYHQNRDKPQVATLNLRHDWVNSAASVDFIYGLRHWEYQTVKFTYAWKFDGI